MRTRPVSSSRRRTLKRGLAAILALPFAAALVSMLGSVRRSQQPAAFRQNLHHRALTFTLSPFLTLHRSLLS